MWSPGEGSSEKELLLVTDVSTTWAEVIFRVKWIVLVSRWWGKSGPLKVIGQFSRDCVSWKTRVKFVSSRWSVQQNYPNPNDHSNGLLILLSSNHLLCKGCYVSDRGHWYFIVLRLKEASHATWERIEWLMYLTIDVLSTFWGRACLKNVPTLSTETGESEAQPSTWTTTWWILSSCVS